MDAEQTLKAVVAEVRNLATKKPDKVYIQPDHDRLDIDWYDQDSMGVNPKGEDGDPAHLADCLYIHKYKADDNAVGGCIVGQAMLNVGIDIDLIKAREGEGANEALHKVLDFEGELHEGKNSAEVERQLDFLRRVQAEQDYGVSWGDALAAADSFDKIREANNGNNDA